MKRKLQSTSRQPGFALVQVIGLDRCDGESLTVLVSRVPCVGEEMQIEDDAPQVVSRVRHQMHPSGFSPEDTTVDALVFLDPFPETFIPPRRHSASMRTWD